MQRCREAMTETVLVPLMCWRGRSGEGGARVDGELEPWVQTATLPLTGCLNLGSFSASGSFSFLSCEVETIHTSASSLF